MILPPMSSSCSTSCFAVRRCVLCEKQALEVHLLPLRQQATHLEGHALKKMRHSLCFLSLIFHASVHEHREARRLRVSVLRCHAQPVVKLRDARLKSFRAVRASLQLGRARVLLRERHAKLRCGESCTIDIEMRRKSYTTRERCAQHARCVCTCPPRSSKRVHADKVQNACPQLTRR